MKRVACLLITLLAGCDLYWSHNSGDDTVCAGGETEGAPAAPYRDPTTGACDYYGGGGCDPCAPCPVYNGADIPATASCAGACEGLDESSCLDTTGCHAEYGEYDAADGGAPPTDMAAAGTFVSCWDIAPLPVLDGSDCTQLDPFTCAQHDDCVSIMNIDSSGTAEFAECAPESGSTGDCASIDCGSGFTCEEQCVPCDGSDGACMGGCGAVCVPSTTCDDLACGSGSTCGVTCDDTGTCSPECIPNTPPDPGSCTGVVCNIVGPACPAGTTPGVENGCWTGFCIPNDQCGPSDPGSCDQSQLECDQKAPECPTGTVPGVLNNCYSGYCIPQSACPVPACETLAEDACLAREPDCTPVYSGSGCTCDSNGICNCAAESFARCMTIDIYGGGSDGVGHGSAL